MIKNSEPKEELLKELEELKLENASLKAMYEQDLAEHRKVENLLRESNDNYSDLVENSSDLICTHDLDGNLLSINNAAINITGYSKEEAIKMNMQDIIVSEYRRIFDAYLAKIKAMGHAQGFMIIQTKTGERRIWEYNNTLRTEGIAKPIVRGMVKDVTKLKSTEAILKKLNAELAKSNAEKDKFFSIIAHDLKAPFLGFLGLTQEIVQNASNISALELTQLWSTMHKAADNLFNLLNNLLEWSQMQKGSVSFQSKELSLSALIVGNIELIKGRGVQKGIAVTNAVSGPVYTYTYEKMINSILLNLLSNAIKFTHRNGTVTITAKKTEDQMVEIAICDSGIGMQKNLLERLFKAGEKTGKKGTDGELSTGLGLLLCKEFVEKHGGEIWVESQENIGSTFYFTIPLSNK